MEQESKNAGSFFKKLDLFRLAGQSLYHQLLVTLSKSIAFNRRIFFHLLAITIALIKS